ncbi:MAG: hypothetical protein FWE84_06425 [Firmicutes bacterium]|nr:hypothetical protein [Bacillota bacterium]
MEKTIYDVMTDDPLKIQQFKTTCAQMLGCPYIVANSKISAILQCVASSKLLYGLFGCLLEKFNYKETAKNCQTADGKIILPKTQEDITAFVFCVLLDIDRHNIELKDFLQFFGGEDSATAFKEFQKDFIMPFRNAAVALAECECAKFEQKNRLLCRQKDLKQVEQSFDCFMGTLTTRINSDRDLHTVTKDDLTVLCGSFAAAVHSGDLKQSRALYARILKKLRIHKPSLARELEKFDLSII